MRARVGPVAAVRFLRRARGHKRPLRACWAGATLDHVRWIGVWVGVGVMVVGCSRDNPGFVLNTNGDPEASTTIPAPSTGTTVPETTGSGGSAVDSGTTETTGAPGHDSSGSEGAASTSTSTGEASTGASGTSTDTGAASTSDSGSDSSSTGGPEPGEEVLPWAYDLYLRCTDANTTQWKASGNLQLFCNLGPKAPQVRQLGDMYIYDGAPREALGVEPNPVMDNEIVGYFGGISLPQEVPARLRTTLYFPAMSGRRG